MANRACPGKDGGVCFVPDPMTQHRVRRGSLIRLQARPSGSERSANETTDNGPVEPTEVATDALLTVDVSKWRQLSPQTIGPEVFEMIRYGDIAGAARPIRLRGFETVRDGVIVQCSPCGDTWVVPVK